MNKLSRDLIVLFVALFVLVGIPYIFENQWLLIVSWIPALFSMIYLDEM